MVNYQNGKIYKIINENNDIVYIGSTTQYYLSVRYAKHEYKAPNHKIILIENYPCSNCEELRKREQEIIEEHSNLNLLNIKKAYQSLEDFKYRKSIRDEKYRLKHKEKIKDKRKEHYENNKNEYKNKRKELYQKNKNKLLEKITCEFCGSITVRNNIWAHQKTMKCKKFQFIED